MDEVRPLRLRCPVQPYAWGRAAEKSIISGLGSCYSCPREGPLAEMWIGDHRSAPAEAFCQDQWIPLPALIQEQGEAILGREVLKNFGRCLPFLLKVLSIGRPLSIQSHPDRESAARLHEREPRFYPDSNYKPEIAVALCPVTLLFGFRPWPDICAAVAATPEFEILLQGRFEAGPLDAASAAIRRLYSQVMTASPDAVIRSSLALYGRLEKKKGVCPAERWILELRSDYPDGDIGLFSFYLLNLVSLQPGEGIFIAPNTLHAYLEGEIIECMANSDNVIRGGLTRKRTDVDILLSLLDFNAAEAQPLRPAPGGGFVPYPAPVPDFILECLSGRGPGLDCTTGGKPAVLLSLRGQAAVHSQGLTYQLSHGDTLLLPAGVESYRVEPGEGMLFRAAVP